MKPSGIILGAIAILVMSCYPNFSQVSTTASLDNLLNSTISWLTSGLSLNFLLTFSSRSTYPITAWDRFFAKILSSGVIDTTLVDLGYQWVGEQQCRGFQGNTGIPIFSIFSGIWTGDTNADFGGNYLCNKTCVGGQCAPYAFVGEAPASLYPLGCQCGNACNANGPVSEIMYIPAVEIRCDPNPNCECGTIYPDHNSTQGYLCNWWNVALNTNIRIKLSYGPELSPVRWCACCANQ